MISLTLICTMVTSLSSTQPIQMPINITENTLTHGHTTMKSVMTADTVTAEIDNGYVHSYYLNRTNGIMTYSVIYEGDWITPSVRTTYTGKCAKQDRLF